MTIAVAAPQTVEPKFATPRDESRPTIGPLQAKFSEVWLGRSFMPWQRHLADLAGEMVIDEETGLWVPAHSLVVVTVQRQAGKSHLSLTQTGERAFAIKNFRAWYTAQTGGDARDQFLKFADEVVHDTPLEKMTKTLRGNGHEVMRFLNHSTIRPYAPTEGGIHGKQSDRNDIDEAWAFTAEEGKSLLQGSGPAALTRTQEQTFIWSAGGTAKSTWLAELVDRGRGGDPAVCYVEYGVPDDLPIGGDLSDADYRAIAEHHPAVGHTITVGALKKLRTKLPDDAEFARAAGNRWTEVIGGAIPTDLWKAARYGVPIPAGAKVGYGAATSVDRTETVVVAAAEVDGLVVGEVLEVIHNPYGAAPRVAKWATDGALAVDSRGPSSSLADALVKFPRLMKIGTPEATAAAANWLDGLYAGVIKARRHPSLDAAVQVAVKRLVSDGAFLWARQSAGASIAALEAFGLAAFALGHRPIPAAKPLIDFGGEE